MEIKKSKWKENGGGIYMLHGRPFGPVVANVTSRGAWEASSKIQSQEPTAEPYSATRFVGGYSALIGHPSTHPDVLKAEESSLQVIHWPPFPLAESSVHQIFIHFPVTLFLTLLFFFHNPVFLCAFQKVAFPKGVEIIRGEMARKMGCFSSLRFCGFLLKSFFFWQMVTGQKRW